MAHVVELLPRVVAMLPVDKREELARLLAEQRAIEVLVQGKQVAKGRAPPSGAEGPGITRGTAGGHAHESTRRSGTL